MQENLREVSNLENMKVNLQKYIKGLLYKE